MADDKVVPHTTTSNGPVEVIRGFVPPPPPPARPITSANEGAKPAEGGKEGG